MFIFFVFNIGTQLIIYVCHHLRICNSYESNLCSHRILYYHKKYWVLSFIFFTIEKVKLLNITIVQILISKLRKLNENSMCIWNSWNQKKYSARWKFNVQQEKNQKSVSKFIWSSNWISKIIIHTSPPK